MTLEEIQIQFPSARAEKDGSIVISECSVCANEGNPNKKITLFRKPSGKITGASCTRFIGAGREANRAHCAPVLEQLGVKATGKPSFISSEILDGSIVIEVDPVNRFTQFVTIRNGIGVLHNGEVRLGKMIERAEFVQAIANVPEDAKTKIGSELVQMLDRLRRTYDAIDPEDKGENEERESAATRLVKIAEKNAVLVHNSDGDGYALMMIDGHKETWPLRSKGFKQWLARKFYLEFNKSPGAQAIQDALGVIEGNARYAGEERAIYVRLGEKDGKIYLDLADDQWRAVEIDAAGWRVMAIPPVEFRRTKGMEALPVPERGGDIETLREFLNLEKDSDLWTLMRGSILVKFRPKGPYPVDVFTGEQGCGKTTRARMIRALVDPSKAPTRTEPREIRDLHIASSNEWMPIFDNLSRIPQWLSDAFCCLSTGGGMRLRELYSDSDETIFSTTRPMILTSITEVVERPDLLDRSIIHNLPIIEKGKRKSEKEIWTNFEKARPAILGALLNAVSAALKNEDAVELEDPPRMADFARWAIAGEKALGIAPGQFIKAYTTNLSSGNDLALEAIPYSETLIKFVKDEWALAMARGEGGQPGTGTWIGSATELFGILYQKFGGEGLDDQGKRRLQADGWPKRPKNLSEELRRIAPNLRKKGIETQFGIREGKKRGRKLSLLWTPPTDDENDDPNDPKGEKVGFSASAASAASASDQPFENKGNGPTDWRTQENSAASAASADGEAKTYFDEADAEGTLADAERTNVLTFCVRQETIECSDFTEDFLEADEADAEKQNITYVALDTETTGLSRTDRMIGLSLSYDGTKADYVTDASAWPMMMPDAEMTVVLHNSKFDLGVLAREGLPTAVKWEDTLIAAHILDENVDHGLKDLAKAMLGVEEPLTYKEAERMRLLDPEVFAEYARNDARYTYRLWQKFEPEIEAQGVRSVYELEKAIVPVVMRMEDRGILLDVASLGEMAQLVNAEIERTKEEVFEYAGCPFDLNSTQKTAVILYDKLGIPSTKETTTGQRSVDREALEDVLGHHPAVDAILRYREYDKLASTFINKLPEFADANGRIHPEFRSLGAVTGRFSCSNPNVQQIPSRSELGKKLRRAFIAGEGRKLVVADYSQMELRILAHYSQDPLLLAAYQSESETDLHTLTASKMFGKSIDEISKKERSVAKMINFGVAYGITPVGLFTRLKPSGIDVSIAECEKFISDYFQAYGKVKKLLADIAGAVKKRGYVKNLYGRRRRVAGESKREIRQAQNFVIQGTAADMARTAMIRIHQALPEDAYLIAMVHDEMIVDCREDQAEDVKLIVESAMQETPSGFTVPMVAEAKIGDSWGECK